MTKNTPPRAVFVDRPVGRAFGRPNGRARQEEILTQALAELTHFTRLGEIRDLRCRWEPDDSRAWEAELRQELLGPQPEK